MRAHHTGYLVKNIEKARRAFETLGYEREGDITRDDLRGVDILFMRSGAQVVELISPAREDSQVSGLMRRAGNSPYHICYEVDDIRASADALAKRGFVLMGDPAPAPAIGERPVLFMMNAAIGIIELVEARREFT